MSLDLGAKFVAVMAYEPTFGAIGSCGLDVDRSMETMGRSRARRSCGTRA